jgi:flagellar protein FliS
MTASPAKLVAMLYDKAVQSLREAIRAIEAGNIQERYNANKRAGDIITHLWTTLDAERGGEIAANLARLYSFMLSRLTFVDVHNDPEPAREVIGLLEPLRESWTQLAHGDRPARTETAKTAVASVSVSA